MAKRGATYPDGRTCPHCNTHYPEADQHFRKCGRQCIACINAKRREGYDRNRAARRAYMREYSQKNRDHIAQQRRERDQARRAEKRAERRAAGKVCAKCKARFKDVAANFYRVGPSRPGQWFAYCKACHNANLSQRRKANPAIAERARAYSREWYRRNPDRMRALVARRRAREMNAGPGYSDADVRNQYGAQSGRCYWCKESVGDTYHVDHVIPISKGGSHGRENIVIACPPCNMTKKAKMPWEFAGVLL